MFGIGHLFGKIQNSFAKEALFRITIKEIIEKHSGVSISIESINIRNSIVFLDGLSSSAKSVIFIKKQKIISEILETKKIKAVVDIR